MRLKNVGDLAVLNGFDLERRGGGLNRGEGGVDLKRGEPKELKGFSSVGAWALRRFGV